MMFQQNAIFCEGSMQKLLKKYLSAALAVSIALSCCACGSASAAPETAQAGETAASSAAAEASSADTAAEESAAEASALPDTQSPFAGSLLISEVMTDNKATLRDADGDFSDWFELSNTGSSELMLGGWHVSDQDDQLGWELPAVTLAPGEQLLIFASEKDRTGDELHTDFRLSEKDTLTVRDDNGFLVARLSDFTGKADRSTALQADGSYAASLTPTPGYPNTNEGWDAFQSAQTSPGPLIISEVVVSNIPDFYYTNALSGYDWIELKNISDAPVELSDYALSDKAGNPLKAILPAATLQPGERTVLVCTTEDGEYSYFYKNIDLSLDAENERLYLSSVSGELIDYLALKGLTLNGSCGRMDGENGSFYFASPTPGAENTDGHRRVAEQPTAAEPDGVYENVSSVTVTLSAPGAIYYTLDGSKPTTDSKLYTEPIRLEATTVVRAINVEPDAVTGRPLTLTYLINEGLSLPVASLVTDNVSYFNAMFYESTKGVELPGNLSFYEEDGSGFNIGCGVKMHGDTSLQLDKKSMSVRFRSAYGAEELSYDLFGGGVTEFSGLLVRGGSDFYSSIIRDELGAELCQSFTDHVIAQRYRYCVLFVNGTYYGIYALKEKADEATYAAVNGVSKDSVEACDVPLYSNSAAYIDLLDYVFTHDMSDSACYAHFCEVMDIDNLIDWVIIEGYTGNNDLYSGNLRYVRSSEDDGKWRILLYDLDSIFYSNTTVFTELFGQQAAEGKQIGQLLAELTKNAEFCDALLTRAGEVMNNVLTPDYVVSVIDRLADEIAPEVDRDVTPHGWNADRWRGSVEFLRNQVADGSWNLACRKALISLFDLSEVEAEHYFGPEPVVVPTPAP